MPLNILIAEDEEDISEQYKMGFEDRGHKVKITYDGVDCIYEYLRARKTLRKEDPIIYDAVIIDYNMPFKNGATLALEIRDVNPEQAIVFVTAYGNQLISGLDSFEDVDILAKPLLIKNLIRLVEERCYNKVLA